MKVSFSWLPCPISKGPQDPDDLPLVIAAKDPRPSLARSPSFSKEDESAGVFACPTCPSAGLQPSPGAGPEVPASPAPAPPWPLERSPSGPASWDPPLRPCQRPGWGEVLGGSPIFLYFQERGGGVQGLGCPDPSRIFSSHQSRLKRGRGWKTGPRGAPARGGGKSGRVAGFPRPSRDPLSQCLVGSVTPPSTPSCPFSFSIPTHPQNCLSRCR